MNPEVNSPEEMGKRFLYLVSQLTLLSAVLAGVVAILDTSFTSISLTWLLGGISYWLKLYGEKHLDFPRLSKSFPFGTPEDEIPDVSRKEIQELLLEFDTADKDWEKRALVRRRLQEISRNNYLVLSVYKKDIQRVCPMIGMERQATCQRTRD